MKALVVRQPGEIDWAERERPQPPPDWALVRVSACGICASDLPRALQAAAYRYPIVLGHEIAGVVAEVGSGVSAGWIGRRVAVAPLIPCRRCQWCRQGRYGLCQDYDYLGSRRDGGNAEFVAAPAANLVRLPQGVTEAQAALLEPAAVVMHGLAERVPAGASVMVLGAGPIGLLAVQIALILGADSVVVSEPDPARLQLARALGGSMPLPAGSDGGGLRTAADGTAELVIVATGAPSAHAQALQMAGRGGKILVLGVPTGSVSIPRGSYEAILRHEIRIDGSWNSYGEPFPGPAWGHTLNLIQSGELSVDSLISDRVPMAEGASAYRALAAGGSPKPTKILLVP